MEILFDIPIQFKETIQVCAKEYTVNSIAFGGDTETAYFKGKVLPGGIDIQIIGQDGNGTLSARYILEEKDAAGKDCRVFVLNEGLIEKDGSLKTHPKILTDSEELSRFQEQELKCMFENRDDQFHVIIYAE